MLKKLFNLAGLRKDFEKAIREEGLLTAMGRYWPSGEELGEVYGEVDRRIEETLDAMADPAGYR